MYKIDKTLVDNMNVNKSFIVISNKDNSQKNQSKQTIDLSDVTEEEIPDKVKQKIAQMVKEAQAEADAVRTQARVEAENIKASAVEQGYREGAEGADEKVAQHVDREVAALKNLMTRLYAYERELLAEMQDSVLALSLDIAEKIVNIQLKRDDIVFIGIIKDAVSRLKRDEKFALRVSKTEYERFFKDGAQWFADQIDSSSFEVICDPEMKSGDCVVESESKIVDAGVSLQIKKVKAALSGKAD